MHVSKSGAHSGARISELKEIMELVSDPKKVRDALDDLAAKHKEVDGHIQTLSEKQAFLKEAEDAHDARSKDVEEASAALLKREKEFEDFQAKFHLMQKDVEAREKKLQHDKAEFESLMVEKEQAISEQEAAVSQKLEDAGVKLKQFEALKADYETKSKKLKEAMGV